MKNRHVELSDCWSSEQQPAAYYRVAAARARRLQADATTPRVKQYLDKMIAHCEELVGNVEPATSPGCDSRYTGRSRMAKNHDRLRRGSYLPRTRGVVVQRRDWMVVGGAQSD
jgi:hypothetical protein